MVDGRAGACEAVFVVEDSEGAFEFGVVVGCVCAMV
jgi:hypothetical protein